MTSPDPKPLLMPLIRLQDWRGALRLVRQHLGPAQPSPLDCDGGIRPLPLQEAVLEWVGQFLHTWRHPNPAALYFEIDFDPSTPMREGVGISGIAYPEDGGEDDSAYEWLSLHYPSDRIQPHLEVGGFEPFMVRMVEADETAMSSDAWQWGQWVIHIRFLELMEKVHNAAWERGLPWAKAPFYLSSYWNAYLLVWK